MDKVLLSLKTGHKKAFTQRQADALVRAGVGNYMTRDMVASSPASVIANQAAGTELDSAGAAWDESIHVSTKLKNSDGTWRKRPGTKASQQ